jgi:hypothetical protein
VRVVTEKTFPRSPQQRVADIRAQIAEENPEALFADGFDDALIGAARRCGQPTLAAYHYWRAVRILSTDMTVEEAVEYMEFNVVGAWMGPHTPVWIVE